MKLHLIIYIALAATLAGCAEKQDRELKALVTEMRESYAEGRDSACLAAIDTLRAKFPKAIAERKEALKLYQEASLRIAQKQLAYVDSALETEKNIFQTMEKSVAAHKEAGIATAEELTALTRKRMLRDSLQTQFDVLCAKIKYIHKRQKQATEQ